jgi:hypothetical protein
VALPKNIGLRFSYCNYTTIYGSEIKWTNRCFYCTVRWLSVALYVSSQNRVNSSTCSDHIKLNSLWTTIFKGTVSRDFWSSVFSSINHHPPPPGPWFTG